MSNSTLEQWRAIQTKDEILTKELTQKDELLADAFSTNMEFGTAGIRGVMGAGTNKMNIHTVAAAAEAYAQFLIKNVKGAKTKGVVVGHDNRYNSALFSETVANVLLNNGIKAYLFEGNELQPTPLVSYVIRKMKLAGGAIVTASHNPKEYNGFKVYNQLGGQLMVDNTKSIQVIMAKINPLDTKKETDREVKFVPSPIVDEYINDLLSKIRLRSDDMDIKVAFSPLHGTTGKLAPRIFEEMGVEHIEVEKQLLALGSFKHAKSTNPEEAKAYNKVVSLARRKKADMAIVTDPDGDRVGAVVKYQRRYKFLNGNQMAALYLDYKLTQLKRAGNLPEDGYIIKSVVSGDLPSRIAEKFGVRVIETHVGFKNIAEVMEKTKGTFIMGYEESYGFALDKSLTRDKDSLQAMIGLIEMTNYYKSQNINVYTHLEGLWKQYGIHRSTQFGKVISQRDSKNIMRHLLKVKKIGNVKIKEIQDYRKGYKDFQKTNLIKVTMENGSWFAVRPSGTEPKMKFYIQTIGKADQELIDIVVFEKQVGNYISDISEVFENKKFSTRTFIKYFIFLSIMAVIVWFTFTTIYDSAKSSSKSATFIASVLFNSKSRSIFLIWILATIVGLFLTSIQRKRLISYHGQKVKMRHVMVSAVMGSFVSWVTPFTIGGDAIGYWYLRRKGFKRGALISSYMTSTLIWQFSMILITAILVPLGFMMYKDQFANGDIHMKAVLYIFITGISWDVFATFMIALLTFNKRFQEWIVRTSIKLLEWLPFIHIQDPGLKAAGPQYEFKQMRDGMKLIFGNKKLLLEALSYRLIGKFLVIAAFVPIALNIMNPGLRFGDYFSQVVVNDFIRAANGMSITPGGSGTGEYISINLNSSLWIQDKSLHNLSPKEISVGIDMLSKFISSWPYLVLSVVTIGVIFAGEKRADVHKRKNMIRTISRVNEGHSRSSFYLKISPIWFLLATSYLLVFFLI